MKSFLIILALFLATDINCEETQKDYFDLSNDEEHVFVVKLIFKKLNEVLNETASNTAKIDDINGRFGELNTKVNGLTQDVATFKADVSKEIEEKISSLQTSTDKRFDDLDKSLSDLTNNNVISKSDILKTMRDQTATLEKDLNKRVNDLDQLLKKSLKEIETFRAEISKTVHDQITTIYEVGKETVENPEKQANQTLENSTDWIGVLRRKYASSEFNRNWTDYKNGFVDKSGDYFIGLETLHKMTSNGKPHELLITLEYSDNHQIFAKYDNIVIGSEAEGYALKFVGKHSGEAEDSLRHHEGEKFTTIDRDNDYAMKENCAKSYGGPWWYYQCNPSSQLFGPYQVKGRGHRIRWDMKKLDELTAVVVKIRQIDN